MKAKGYPMVQVRSGQRPICYVFCIENNQLTGLALRIVDIRKQEAFTLRRSFGLRHKDRLIRCPAFTYVIHIELTGLVVDPADAIETTDLEIRIE